MSDNCPVVVMCGWMATAYINRLIIKKQYTEKGTPIHTNAHTRALFIYLMYIFVTKRINLKLSIS